MTSQTDTNNGSDRQTTVGQTRIICGGSDRPKEETGRGGETPGRCEAGRPEQVASTQSHSGQPQDQWLRSRTAVSHTVYNYNSRPDQWPRSQTAVSHKTSGYAVRQRSATQCITIIIGRTSGYAVRQRSATQSIAMIRQVSEGRRAWTSRHERGD